MSSRFRLGRVLKASASATVYLATERGEAHEVVVKIIGLTEPLPPTVRRTRFVRAVSLLRELAHPAFPPILEVGFSGDTEAYIVAEKVEATPLPELPDVPPSDLLGYLAQAARGLDRLHTAGTAHLNVQPSNILLTSDGTVRLVGLGTCWLQQTEVAGPFSAPELTDSLETQQPWRADVYGFARTACATLGLAAVPEGSQRFVVETPEQIRQLFKDPGALQRVLERSLHRLPEERPSSLSEVIREIEQAAGIRLVEPSAAPTDGPPGSDRALEKTVRLDPAAVARLRARQVGLAAHPLEESPADGHAGPDLAPQETAAPEAVPPAEPLPPSPPSAVSTLERPLERTTSFEMVDPATAREVKVPPSASGDGAAGSAPSLAAEVPTEPPPGLSSSAEAGQAPPRRKKGPDTAPIAVPPNLIRSTTTSTPTPTEAAKAAEGAPPSPSEATAEPTEAMHSYLGRPWLWAAFTGTVVTAAMVAWLLLVPRTQRAALRSEPPAAPAVAPIVPPADVPATQTTIDEAEALLSSGRIGDAETALGQLDEQSIAALARPDRERVVAIRTAIVERRRWDMVRELDGALAAADLRRIDAAVQSLAGEGMGPAQSIELQRKLAQARGLVELSRRLSRAERGGRWPEVLDNASTILKTLPNCREADAARTRAAEAIEHQAEDLVSRGNTDTALAQLATLRQGWPERPGVQDRISELEARRAADRRNRELIAQAVSASEDGHPERGLAILATLPANRRNGADVVNLRARLSGQLAQIDSGIPRISPSPDSTLQYEKDEPAVVRLRTEDDLGVMDVAFYARREGGEGYAQFVAVEDEPDTWVVRIPVAFHQNKTIEFYAEAVDASDHRGELGNAAAPFQLKRRRRGLFGR